MRPDKRLLASVIGRSWYGWERAKKDPTRLEVSSEARIILRAIRLIDHHPARDDCDIRY
jgi:hypothetical protein